jgi:TetR/AcrR family transcriptional regulator, regulator of cefoperazone and chloramphenicol sensitivity
MITMRPDRQDTIDIDIRSKTQKRIVAAASEIFANNGYRHSTIRAISDRASVNVAAINYHFGGKKNLYLAVLKYWQTKAFEKYPFDPSDITTGTPQKRLGAFVRVLLFRVLDDGDGSQFAKLLAQEFIQPTAGLDVMIEETVRPFYTFLSTTVRQLFPILPSDETLNLCCLSIAGQVFHLYMGRHVMRRLLDRDSLDRKEIEMVADHITRFSLYAIEAIAAHTGGENK